MSTETLAPHPDCERVARLVAAEVAVIEQAFARRTAKVLLDMCPPVRDNETWVATATFEASARVILRLAGLDMERTRAEQVRG